MQFHINKFSRSASSDPTARTPPSPCLPLCSCHCHSSSSAALLSTTANATGSHLLRSSLSFGVLSSPPPPPPKRLPCPSPRQIQTPQRSGAPDLVKGSSGRPLQASRRPQQCDQIPSSFLHHSFFVRNPESPWPWMDS